MWKKCPKVGTWRPGSAMEGPDPPWRSPDPPWRTPGSPKPRALHLNNLYGLVPPPGRRRFFWLGLDKGRRVSRTLFVNWLTCLIFRTVFGHKFRAGPPYNDQKWEPIYLFLLSAKNRAQYMYFSTIFLNILGSDFVTIWGTRLFT